ncbi:acyltransferase ChoActase/COT/CPT [Suillus bovinus]|uniref:acyltransferase ChoActase/COT/CPT n=1 Tax=Suillus bovinus TaxID=48563 RepID=UPI001B87539C|nr:acyltransferase ChoActase/COT/CPT [Suillus bovinus]KAG2146165.1 acyltransferase ChoActase/COT/CPT [Suillus bovinus]
MISRSTLGGRIAFPYCSRLSRSSPYIFSSRRARLSTMEKLPRLPVPDLRKTLDRYLQSIQPFLREDEARGHSLFESNYEKRVQWADDFEKGIGRLCQHKLHELDARSPHNWLDDNIWTNYAYLSWRVPLLINSNWWLTLVNDPSIPESILRGDTRSGIEPWQVRRAAYILHRVLDWRARMVNQHPDPDTTRTGVWLLTNTEKMFNTCRLPRTGADVLATRNPSSEYAQDIMLMLYDFVYTVRVCEDDRTPLPVQTIEDRIRAVVLDVIKRMESGESAVPVGVLTSDDRDCWAEDYQHLLSLSPTNASTFRAISESIMALSLDHYTAMPSHYPISTSPNSSQSSQASIPALDTDAEILAHLYNTRSPPRARNRFFDKSLTLSLERNTRTGVMGEHAPVDALVPSIVFDYGVVAGIEPSAFSEPVPRPLTLEEARVSDGGKGWSRWDWVTDERIEARIREAEGRAQASINNSDAGILDFGEYGADWISSVAHLPPDAYTQLALQLAWYRSRGFFTATYETALTRMFNAGRTECVRSASVEALDFVQAAKEWGRGTECVAEGSQHEVEPRALLHLLQHAIRTHARRTREAATGRGIDRHLLGLKLMLEELPVDASTSALSSLDSPSSSSPTGLPQKRTHPLFADPLFSRSQEWKLSTSGLSAGDQFRGTGFGAGWEDGYGINYLIAPRRIKFCIESKFSSPLTSTNKFKQHIADALQDMRAICEAGELELKDIKKKSVDGEDTRVQARL